MRKPTLRALAFLRFQRRSQRNGCLGREQQKGKRLLQVKGDCIIGCDPLGADRILFLEVMVAPRNVNDQTARLPLPPGMDKSGFPNAAPKNHEKMRVVLVRKRLLFRLIYYR